MVIVVALRYPDDERVDYEYDAGGLLEKATGHRGVGAAVPGDEVYLASMMYDEFGQRVRMVLGNGVVSSYRYEPLTRRLHTLATKTPLPRTLQAITYGYDRVGNVKTMVNALGEPVGDRSGDVRFEYGYDELCRLTWANGEAQARVHTIDRFTARYAYSDVHNMTSNVQVHEVVHGGAGVSNDRPPKTNHEFAYAYDPAHPHQATKIGDTFLTYDGNGNTVRECRDQGDPTCQTSSDRLRRLVWTEENRLDQVIDGGGRNITRFVYDAGGDRVVKLGRGGESITVGQFWSLKGRRAATKHIFGGATRLASKVLPPPGWGAQPANPTTGATTSPTLAGNTNGCDPSNYQPQKCPVLPGGVPEINHQYDDTRVRPETYYYHPDHLGSTSWVTDQHARVHEHVEYFPYGEVWRDPRSDADGAPVKGQRFLFTGKELDEETGLVYFGARYYEPRTALWKNVDPALMEFLPLAGESPTALPGMGGVFNTTNLNVYNYVGLNPVLYVDPSGRDQFLYFWKPESTASGAGHVAIGIGDMKNQAMFEANPVRSAMKAPMAQPVRTTGSMQEVLAGAHNKRRPDLILKLKANTVEDAAANAKLEQFFRRHSDWRLHNSNCASAATTGVKATKYDPGYAIGIDSPVELAQDLFENNPAAVKSGDISVVQGDWATYRDGTGAVRGVAGSLAAQAGDAMSKKAAEAAQAIRERSRGMATK